VAQGLDKSVAWGAAVMTSTSLAPPARVVITRAQQAHISQGL